MPSSEVATRRDATLEGRVVPSRGSGASRGPRTEYVFVSPAKSQQKTPGYRVGYTGKKETRKPSGMPQWLANREIIFGAWMGTMVLVSLDEWKQYGILPRPMRLWYTSAVFFILAGISAIDILAPLANLFAVGFFFAVLWQYLTATGQFSGGTNALGGATSAAQTAGEGAVSNSQQIIQSIIQGASNVGNSANNAVTKVFGPGQKTAPNG